MAPSNYSSKSLKSFTNHSFFIRALHNTNCTVMKVFSVSLSHIMLRSPNLLIFKLIPYTAVP